MKKLKKKIFHKAYSMIEMSLLILIIGILFAGAYQGFNIYNETKLSSVRTLMQNSIISLLKRKLKRNMALKQKLCLFF